MLNIRIQLRKLLCMILLLAIILPTTACTSSIPNLSLSDPNEQIITENVEVETILTENVIHSLITTEIYLEEIVIAEDKIRELLLEEETINEVLLCQTIYVPQENIEEFAVNSQTAHLFGNEIDINSVFKKIAIGTGVIVTIVILKKSGFAEPIASIVAAAADESLRFAGGGAAIGSLFGGVTGAADEIDQSGKTSAILGFAVATAGLIISIVHLVALVPTGGTSSIGLASGIKLVIAGIGTGIAAYETVKTGYDAINALTATDAADIDWDNIDWERVGVSAAQKAINYGADGYMWGAIAGAVYGGVEGYDYYHKFNTPYTSYNERLDFVTKSNKKGHWSGEPGESDFLLDEPIELPNGTKITKVTYRNAVPDFSPYEEAEVKISQMTNHRYSDNIIKGNFEQADEALAKAWSNSRNNGRTWSAADVRTYRTENQLTWHEMSNMESMQLVPRVVNSSFYHYGGVAEYNAMIGQKGDAGFD